MQPNFFIGLGVYRFLRPVRLLKAIVLGLILFSASISANAVEKNSNVLRMAVIYIEEPPYIYSKGESGYQGIYPSLAKKLGLELNLNIEFVPTGRKGLEQSIIEGKADVTWLSPDWVENKEQFVFSAPIFLVREFFYSLDPFVNDANLKDWVNNKSICVRQDYLYPKLNSLLSETTAIPVKISSQVPLLMSLILHQRCDLVYTNEHRASWLINKLGIKEKIWRSPKPLDKSNVAFMFNKKWETKVPQINKALAKIRSRGELEHILQTHIKLKKGANHTTN